MPFFPSRWIQCPDISGVANNSVALANLQKGPRYKGLYISMGDTAIGSTAAPTSVGAIIQEFWITYGSGVQRRLTADRLDAINTGMGSQYASQAFVGTAGNGSGRRILPIFFEEPWRKRADYQNGLAWPTDWLGSSQAFQISMKLTNTGGVVPDIKVMALVDDFQPGKPSPILKMFTTDANTAAATVEASNLFQGAPPDDLVSQMSFFDTSDAKTVETLRLKINGQDIRDDVTKAQNNTTLKGYDMNPAAGVYHLVFDHDDMFESLRRVGNMPNTQAKLTLSAASAGTISWVTQRLGLPE